MDGPCSARISSYYQTYCRYINGRSMVSQPLYHIHHLDLREFLENPGDFNPSGMQYLVFWWDDIPLGHLYMDEPGPKVHSMEWGEMVWGAVKPALTYYARKGKMETAALREIFLHQKPEDSRSAFHSLFPPPDRTTKNRASVSLVLCTRNRAKHLENALHSLTGLRPKPLEIIVVDNSPGVGATESVVAGFPEVKYVKEERRGLDYARNLGISVAAGEIIAFTDDDVDLHPDWMWRLADSFSDPQVQAITGLVIAKALDTPAQYYFEKYWGFNRGYTPVYYDNAWFRQCAPAGVPIWEIGAGANMAFRRNILDVLGGFDVRLDMGAAGCNGDSEMWYRILAEGWTVKYDPLVIAYHTHRSEMKDFKTQISLYMRGLVTSVMIEYHRYRNKGERYHLV
ncbi:MAG TPA: glycosyltransferase, partial [Chitinophagaceae bacterium]|nr:glycosyltransferase [Chitinophagaceae bacterium]